ncbi:MAG: CDP-alcohol phosphatidyltransferase family protein, partial [Microbacteriaceae bacterium]
FMVIRDRVIAAAGGGKLKTVMQTIAISFFLVPLDHWFGDWIFWVNFTLMGIALVLTLWSGVQYILALRQPLPDPKASA